MFRAVVFACALLSATGAMACAPDDYLCQGGEKMRRFDHETYLGMQHNADIQRQNNESIERYLDARERAADQAFTDGLIMNLDRR